MPPFSFATITYANTQHGNHIILQSLIVPCTKVDWNNLPADISLKSPKSSCTLSTQTGSHLSHFFFVLFCFFSYNNLYCPKFFNALYFYNSLCSNTLMPTTCFFSQMPFCDQWHSIGAVLINHLTFSFLPVELFISVHMCCLYHVVLYNYAKKVPFQPCAKGPPSK